MLPEAQREFIVQEGRTSKRGARAQTVLGRNGSFEPLNPTAFSLYVADGWFMWVGGAVRERGPEGLHLRFWPCTQLLFLLVSFCTTAALPLTLYSYLTVLICFSEKSSKALLIFFSLLLHAKAFPLFNSELFCPFSWRSPNQPSERSTGLYFVLTVGCAGPQFGFDRPTDPVVVNRDLEPWDVAFGANGCQKRCDVNRAGFICNMFTMLPNLLMRSWMMAHLYGAEYQAVVCYAGSSCEVAFRESLCPQYSSDRHDAKGLRTYHITGTCGGVSISRIASGRIGDEVAGCDGCPLRITITSNTRSWQDGDLSNLKNLISIVLNMRLVEDVRHGFLRGCSSLEEVDLSPLVNLRAVGSYFLSGCSSMKWIDLTPLRAIEVLPDSFFYGCSSLKEVDLSPLVKLRAVGFYFLCECSSMKSIDLTPLRAIEVLPNGFLYGCSSLEDVDLSPLVNLKLPSESSLRYCKSLKAIRLGPQQSDSVLPGEFRELVV